MKVRAISDGDIDELRQIYLDSRKSAFSWLDPKSLVISDFDNDTKGEIIWVSEDEGTPTGFISAWIPNNFIHHLFVSPKHLNKGIGSSLLSHCLKNIGRPAQLKCVVENQAALNFYLKHGWKILSEADGPDGKYKLLEFNET